jgi:hypothetical protein
VAAKLALSAFFEQEWKQDARADACDYLMKSASGSIWGE